jgi:hypothetical protein
MSIRFRNKDGEVSDRRSIHDEHGGRERDTVILDKDGVKEVLAKYFQQQYGHETSPEVDITFFSDGFEQGMTDILVEIEFTEVDDPIQF